MRGRGLQLMWRFVLLLRVTWEKCFFHVYVKDFFFPFTPMWQKKVSVQTLFCPGREGGDAQMQLVGFVGETLEGLWLACD